MDAFFEPIGAGSYRATSHTKGPWSPEFMHAGPPSSLLAHVGGACADLPTARLGRICVDILSPVPVGEVDVRARTLRSGARVALIEAELHAHGRMLMGARLWYIRQASPPAVPATPLEPAPQAMGQARPLPAGWGGGYLDAIEWRWVTGGFDTPGSALVWARPRVGLVAGRASDPVERLLILADSASGISAVASPDELVFVNTDLTVHLLRQPAGESFWMGARTVIDGNGSGITTGTIGDARGEVARTAQLLFVAAREPRPPPTP